MQKDSEFPESEIIDRLIKKVARGGGIVFVGRILQKGLGFLLQVLLGRFLGTGVYGLYALGTNVINLAGQVSMLGFQNGVVRFVALYKGEEDPAKVKGTLIPALVLSTGFSVIVGIILFIFSGQIAGIIFHEPGLSGVIKAFSVSFPFYVFTAVVSAAIRGYQRMEHFVGIQLTRSGTNILLIAIAFLLGFRLYGAIVGFIASAMISAFLGFYLLRKSFPDLVSELKPAFEIRRLLRFSLPMYLAGFTYLIMSRTDIFMLGYFMKSGKVGVYRAAVSITVLVNFALSALNMAFAPLISDLFNKGQLSELRSLFKTVTRWVFTLSLGPVLLMVLFPRNLLSIFGADFTVGWLTVITLALFQLIAVSVGSVGFMLQMTGHQDFVLANNVFTALLNIVLNIWLIPIFGILGAALATGGSLAINNIAGLIEVYVILDFQPWDEKYIKPIIAGISSVAFFFLFSLIDLHWFINLTCICVIYIVTNYFFGLAEEDKLILNALWRKILSRRS